MKNNYFDKKVIPAIMFLFVGITFFSCSYDKVENKPCNASIPNTVSFSNNILPVFSANCSTSSCHSGSNPQASLNLENANAYSQLMKPGKGYINLTTPNFSILYSQMISTSQPMPPSGNLDACTIEMVLKWIQQGAKNN